MKPVKLLEIEGNYARLKDYISTINEYKLEKMMNHIRSGEQVTDKRGIEEADEKFNIINLVCTGAMMKIFPCRNIAGKTLEWYSQSDQLPQDMDNDKWVFIRKSMSYVNEMIVMKKYNDACLLLEKSRNTSRKSVTDCFLQIINSRLRKYIINLIIANLSPWHVFASA